MRRFLVWALVLVPLMVLLPAGSASAVAFPPITPGLPVVTVLPSTVIGAAGGGLSSPEALIKFMRAGSVDGPVWKLTKAAQAAQAAGTATSTELALLGTTAAEFAPMSTRLALMTKAAGLAGPAAVVVSGFSLGLGAGDTGARLLGFKDSDVCSIQNGVLTAVANFTNNVDCTAYTNALTKAQQDFGVQGTSTLGRSCDGPTCLTFDHEYLSGGLYKVWCGHPSGGSMTEANFGSVMWVKPAGVPGWSILPVSGGANGDCASPDLVRAPVYGTGAGYNPTIEQWILGNQANESGPFVGASATAVTTTKSSPDRTWQCTITNTDGSTATSFSPTFVEPDAVLAVPNCPQGSPGKVPDSVDIGEKTGTTVIPVIHQPTTPQWKASRVAYPNCGTGLCNLELTPVATPTITCHMDPTACAGWFKDPAKTSKFKCTYGAYDAPLAECTTLAPTFEPDATATGKTLGDPETGLAGPQVSATEDPGTGRDSSGRCFPSGWGVFNPVQWVMKPVACALEWAFVPDPAVISKVEGDAKKGWDESTPGQIARDVAVSIGTLGVVDGDCGGIRIDWPSWNASGAYALTTEHVLAACPGDFFAKWAPMFSVFIGGSFSIIGLLGAKRLISALFGFHDPGVSV